MEPTLEVGNVDGWVNHSQFVARGVKPVFDQIESIGENLMDVRNRLQMITEMIQTSALIVEAEATSGNTQTLRRIASAWYFTGFGVVGVVLTTLLSWLVDPVPVRRFLEVAAHAVGRTISSLAGSIL